MALVTAALVAAVAFSWLAAPWLTPPAPAHAWPGAAPLAVLILLSEVVPVRVGRGHLSLGLGAVLAGAIVFPEGWAAALLAWHVAVHHLLRRKNAARWLANSAHLAAGLVAFSEVYDLLAAGWQPASGPPAAGPLLAGTAAFAVVSSLVLSAFLSLGNGASWPPTLGATLRAALGVSGWAGLVAAVLATAATRLPPAGFLALAASLWIGQLAVRRVTAGYGRRAGSGLAGDRAAGSGSRVSRTLARPTVSLAAIHLRIDNLEDIRAAQGRGAGEVAIDRTARLVRRAVREADRVVRVEDDLFVVLAGADPDDTPGIAHRIHRALRDIRACAGGEVARARVEIVTFDPRASAVPALPAPPDPRWRP